MNVFSNIEDGRKKIFKLSNYLFPRLSEGKPHALQQLLSGKKFVYLLHDMTNRRQGETLLENGFLRRSNDIVVLLKIGALELCLKRLDNICEGVLHDYCSLQKQPPEVFHKKAVLKNFALFIRKHLCRSLFLIKLQAFRLATLSRTDSNTSALT